MLFPETVYVCAGAFLFKNIEGWTRDPCLGAGPCSLSVLGTLVSSISCCLLWQDAEETFQPPQDSQQPTTLLSFYLDPSFQAGSFVWAAERRLGAWATSSAVIPLRETGGPPQARLFSRDNQTSNSSTESSWALVQALKVVLRTLTGTTTCTLRMIQTPRTP